MPRKRPQTNKHQRQCMCPASPGVHCQCTRTAMRAELEDFISGLPAETRLTFERLLPRLNAVQLNRFLRQHQIHLPLKPRWAYNPPDFLVFIPADRSYLDRHPQCSLCGKAGRKPGSRKTDSVVASRNHYIAKHGFARSAYAEVAKRLQRQRKDTRRIEDSTSEEEDDDAFVAEVETVVQNRMDDVRFIHYQQPSYGPPFPAQGYVEACAQSNAPRTTEASCATVSDLAYIFPSHFPIFPSLVNAALQPSHDLAFLQAKETSYHDSASGTSTPYSHSRTPSEGSVLEYLYLAGRPCHIEHGREDEDDLSGEEENYAQADVCDDGWHKNPDKGYLSSTEENAYSTSVCTLPNQQTLAFPVPCHISSSNQLLQSDHLVHRPTTTGTTWENSSLPHSADIGPALAFPASGHSLPQSVPAFPASLRLAPFDHNFTLARHDEPISGVCPNAVQTGTGEFSSPARLGRHGLLSCTPQSSSLGSPHDELYSLRSPTATASSLEDSALSSPRDVSAPDFPFILPNLEPRLPLGEQEFTALPCTAFNDSLSYGEPLNTRSVVGDFPVTSTDLTSSLYFGLPYGSDYIGSSGLVNMPPTIQTESFGNSIVHP
ncbi:hypothetical protein DL96DRAFT_556046 [Flagelloscypha sp. PMI_526]|nr:hypothetical protein DL96DRAFT_556046 [Flagelloscypha sp. PMI_526]